MRGPLTLATESWQYTRKHLGLFVAIYIFPLIAGVILGSVTAFVFPENGEQVFTTALSLPTALALFLVTLALTVLVSIAGSLALMKAVITPGGTTTRSAYRYGFAHFFAFLWLSALVGLATVLGFALLIIPGIIVSVWFAFTQIVFVQEGLRGMEALRASRMYVKGRWWKVFGRLVAFTAALLLVYVALGIGATFAMPNQQFLQDALFNLANLILMPWSIVYLYFLYKDARGAANAGSSSPIA